MSVYGSTQFLTTTLILGLSLMTTILAPSQAKPLPSACALPSRAPASVFDKDDRVFAPTDAAPYRWVGRLFVNDSTVCTAFLIGERVVMTAAHCVIGQDHQLKSRAFSFQIDLGQADPHYSDDNRFPQPKNRVLRIGVAKGYVGDYEMDTAMAAPYLQEDIAILWLEDAYPKDFGFLPLASTLPYYQPARSVGYPGIYEQQYRVADVNCRVRGKSRDSILTDCAVDRGNSGGPLIVELPAQNGAAGATTSFVAVGVASTSSFQQGSQEIYYEVPYKDSIANRYTQIPLYRTRINAAMSTIAILKEFYFKF